MILQPEQVQVHAVPRPMRCLYYTRDQDGRGQTTVFGRLRLYNRSNHSRYRSCADHHLLHRSRQDQDLRPESRHSLAKRRSFTDDHVERSGSLAHARVGTRFPGCWLDGSCACDTWGAGADWDGICDLLCVFAMAADDHVFEAETGATCRSLNS